MKPVPIGGLLTGSNRAIFRISRMLCNIPRQRFLIEVYELASLTKSMRHLRKDAHQRSFRGTSEFSEEEEEEEEEERKERLDADSLSLVIKNPPRYNNLGNNLRSTRGHGQDIYLDA